MIQAFGSSTFHFRSSAPVALFALAFALVGCRAELSASDEQSAGTEVLEPGGFEADEIREGVGVIPLRRLTVTEYRRTIRHLFGVELTTVDSFAEDSTDRVGYPRGEAISEPELIRMEVEMADVAEAGLDRALGWAGCPGADASCTDSFIREVGKRVFRHPVSPEEFDDLRLLHEAAKNELGFEDRGALELTLRGMLLSPRFHYRWEIGDRPVKVDGGRLALDGYERASALSFFLLARTPDDWLLERAELGELDTSEGLAAAALELVTSPEGVHAMRAFVDGWLRFDESVVQDKAMSGKLREETLRFAEDFVGASTAAERSLARLLTDSSVYQLDETSGDFSKRIDADRSGILTQPGFLAATYSSPLATPVRRGKLLQERLVSCREFKLPEGIEVPPLPEVPEGGSAREAMEQITSEGACASCHSQMNPLGFALSGFAPYGEAREVDEFGASLDLSVLVPLDGGVVVANGSAELAHALAASQQVRDCFLSQAYRYAVRHLPDTEDATQLGSLSDRLAENADDLRALFLLLVETPGFSHRLPASGETF